MKYLERALSTPYVGMPGERYVGMSGEKQKLYFHVPSLLLITRYQQYILPTSRQEQTIQQHPGAS